MQVIMELDEFNRLNESYKILEDVKNYLESVVKYTNEANKLSIFEAWRYTKALQNFEVSKLAYILGLYPISRNIDDN